MKRNPEISLFLIAVQISHTYITDFILPHFACGDKYHMNIVSNYLFYDKLNYFHTALGLFTSASKDGFLSYSRVF